MQEKNLKTPKRIRGRPKTSHLTPREQTRLRKQRQRAKLAGQAISKVEILLPTALKSAITRASGKKTLSEVGEEALRLWLQSHE